jgi:DNA-binding PadR family transcriptional regulator
MSEAGHNLCRMRRTERRIAAWLLEHPGERWRALRLCDALGKGPGSVYPALERMEDHGWVVRHEEAPGVEPQFWYETTGRTREALLRSEAHAQARRDRLARWREVWRVWDR